MRWFVVLILIRPIIDNFYYLKEISPFLSPLYIVGVMTPILILYSTYSKKRPIPSSVDNLFKYWGAIILLGIFIMGIDNLFSLTYNEVVLKISLPIYLYYFLRFFIRSLRDLEGIMVTFVYSSYIVVGIFLFEVFVHPIRLEFSRSMERIQGNYADIFSYSVFITLCTLINLYFLMKKNSTLSRGYRIRTVIITLILAVSMLFKINHAASYVVFTALIIIYILISFRRDFGSAVIVLLLVTLFIYSFGKETIDNKIAPLIQTDREAYEGDRDDSQMLHGRVGRWQNFMEVFNNSDVLTQLLGMPISIPSPYTYITVAPHNDYLRILFLTGYIGLFIYLLILYSIFSKIIEHQAALLYLGMGTLATIILYSISLVPTMYTSFLYIVLSIFSFFTLPKKVRFSSI